MSALIETYPATWGSAARLHAYLIKGRRSLAQDFSFNIADTKFWGAEFDHDRQAINKDSGRKYYHIIISPDPKDNATLDDVRDLATSWAYDNLPPTAKWSINYHDDNENGILHAHLCVNSVLTDGYKIQIDNKQWHKTFIDDLHQKAEELGMTTPAPKTSYEEFKQGKPKYKADITTERRINKRGFRTWKQQLRDLIDLNKEVATSWQNFCDLMDKDGVEVVERTNKRTGDVSYTYHFKEPVFNKRTGKEFHFACKDRNLAKDKAHKTQYTRMAIYAAFNFMADNNKEAVKKLKGEKKWLHEQTMLYFGWLPYEAPKPHRKKRPPLRKHKLPKKIEKIDVKTYHGKLTRATIRQATANVTAMAQAIRIVKEQNIHSQQDLADRQEVIKTTIDELSQKIKAYNEAFFRDKAIYDQLQEWQDEHTPSSKKWLKEHGVDYKTLTVDDQRTKTHAHLSPINELKKQIQILETLGEECEKAYNIINENIKPRRFKPRSDRSAQEVPAKPVVFKQVEPPPQVPQFMQQQQDANNETMANYHEFYRCYKEQNSERAHRLHSYLNAPTPDDLVAAQQQQLKQEQQTPAQQKPKNVGNPFAGKTMLTPEEGVRKAEEYNRNLRNGSPNPKL